VLKKSDTARGPVSRYLYVAIDKLSQLAQGDSPAACCIWLIVGVYYLPLALVVLGEAMIFPMILLIIMGPDVVFFSQKLTQDLTLWYWSLDSFVPQKFQGYGYLAGPTWTALDPMWNMVTKGPLVAAASFALPTVIMAVFWALLLILDFVISGVVLVPMVLISILLLLLSCPCLWVDQVVRFHVSFVNKIVKFINFYWRLQIELRKAAASQNQLELPS